jgi:hypothetical protein
MSRRSEWLGSIRYSRVDSKRHKETNLRLMLLIVNQEVAAEKIAGPGLALTRLYPGFCSFWGRGRRGMLGFVYDLKFQVHSQYYSFRSKHFHCITSLELAPFFFLKRSSWSMRVKLTHTKTDYRAPHNLGDAACIGLHARLGR